MRLLRFIRRHLRRLVLVEQAYFVYNVEEHYEHYESRARAHLIIDILYSQKV